MRILLITDLPWGEEESAVEGLFRHELRAAHEVEVVFHAGGLWKADRRDGAIVLPKRALRHGLWRALAVETNPDGWDYVIVRNKFHVLRQALRRRGRCKVGFWESFPHAYRRVEDAVIRRRGVWRKRLEFRLKKWVQLRMLRRADFFLPITRPHEEEFYPRLGVPSHPLPMGVDRGLWAGRKADRGEGPLRLVYTGTLDKLRGMELICRAVAGLEGDFVLDIYTFSGEALCEPIRQIGDSRIRVHRGLARSELVQEIASAHVGICVLPELRTYQGSSPTKAVEYAALGIVPLVNPLPDYNSWLGEGCAVYTGFGLEPIRIALGRMMARPRSELLAMGEECARRAWRHRDYRVLAAGLVEFLSGLGHE
ncbi:MAG: hypothetical protein RI897_559 [Verrucomicrobiota bacterium]|jgi:hypothetical protein